MKPWSDEEQQILEEFYPHEGALVVERLPGRSRGSIGVRAALHGITMTLEGRRAAQARAGQLRRKNDSAEREHGRPVKPPAVVTTEPEAALPTVLFPVDPDTSKALASACQYLAHFSDAMKEVGPEATRFFDSLSQRLRAHAERSPACL